GGFRRFVDRNRSVLWILGHSHIDEFYNLPLFIDECDGQRDEGVLHPESPYPCGVENEQHARVTGEGGAITQSQRAALRGVGDLDVQERSRLALRDREESSLEGDGGVDRRAGQHSG